MTSPYGSQLLVIDIAAVAGYDYHSTHVFFWHLVIGRVCELCVLHHQIKSNPLASIRNDRELKYHSIMANRLQIYCLSCLFLLASLK